MSDPLYIAAKTALFQFRLMEQFTPVERGWKFDLVLKQLQNAIEAYEAINLSPIPKDFARFDKNSGSYLDSIEEASQ